MCGKENKYVKEKMVVGLLLSLGLHVGIPCVAAPGFVLFNSGKVNEKSCLGASHPAPVTAGQNILQHLSLAVRDAPRT